MLIFGMFGPYFEKTGEDDEFASTRPVGFAAGKKRTFYPQKVSLFYIEARTRFMPPQSSFATTEQIIRTMNVL